MYPHRIRLRGPWEVAEPGQPPVRRELPASLRDIGFAAKKVHLTRRFGYPGRIDAFERVWLTFAEVRGRANIVLNGQALGDIDGPGEFEVTGILRDRNVLEVRLEAASDEDGLTGEVAMEVRCAAYLADVAIVDSVVNGKILGNCPEPLDLYILVDGAEVHYESCQAPSSFAQPLPTGEVVRIDLVQGAVLWGRISCEMKQAQR